MDYENGNFMSSKTVQKWIAIFSIMGHSAFALAGGHGAGGHGGDIEPNDEMRAIFQKTDALDESEFMYNNGRTCSQDNTGHVYCGGLATQCANGADGYVSCGGLANQCALGGNGSIACGGRSRSCANGNNGAVACGGMAGCAAGSTGTTVCGSAHPNCAINGDGSVVCPGNANRQDF